MPLNSSEGMASFSALTDYACGESNDIDSKRKEVASLKLTENFSELINVSLQLPEMDMNEMYQMFTIDDRRYLERKDFTKAECFLLTIVNRGSEDVETFYDVLSEKMGKQFVTDLIMRPGKDVPQHFMQKYKHLSFENINNMRKYLERELEVGHLLVSLLEFGVLSITEYSNIKSNENKSFQRLQVIAVLLSRSDCSWVQRFLYALKQTDQEDILTSINVGRSPTTTDDLFLDEIARTNAIVTIPTYPDSDPEDIKQKIADDVKFIAKCDVIDLWDGSIVIRLLCPRESGKVDEGILHCLLERIYQEYNTSNNLSITVEVKVLGVNEFVVKKNKESQRSISSEDLDTVWVSAEQEKSEKNKCSMCLQEAIRINIQQIVSEVETDIITETLQIKEVSDIVKRNCTNKEVTPSRHQRAVNFIRFIVHEEIYLQQFYRLFQQKSNVSLQPAKCKNCKEPNSSKEIVPQECTSVHHFVFDNGKLYSNTDEAHVNNSTNLTYVHETTLKEEVWHDKAQNDNNKKQNLAGTPMRKKSTVKTKSGIGKIERTVSANEEDTASLKTPRLKSA